MLGIFDSFDALSVAQTTELMRIFRQAGQQFSHGSLVVSRTRDYVGSAEFFVEVEPFNQAELAELVERVTGKRSPELEGFIKGELAGNPRLAAMALTALRTSPDIDLARLRTLIQPFQQTGLVDPTGKPLTDESSELIIVSQVTAINDELLQRLTETPSLLYDLPSDKFEELVAELLARDGFSVTVTPRSRDGGKDIYAARKESIGSFLYVVECKRYAPTRPVGVGLIRNLYGVVEAERASAGLLVTSSYFTRPAQEFRETVPYRLSLKEYGDLKEWIARGFEGGAVK